MKFKPVITLVAASTLMMSAYSVMAGVTSNINSDVKARQTGDNRATANTGSGQYNAATAQAGVGNIDINSNSKSQFESEMNLSVSMNHQGDNVAKASTKAGNYNHATASAGTSNITIR